jgi:hypothetical protein
MYERALNAWVDSAVAESVDAELGRRLDDWRRECDALRTETATAGKPRPPANPPRPRLADVIRDYLAVGMVLANAVAAGRHVVLDINDATVLDANDRAGLAASLRGTS